MELVLGIDLGTSYFKLALFDRTGKLCGLGRTRVPHDTGDPKRCEVPIGSFWAALQQGLAQACREAGAQPTDICAIAYSSQANSFLLLDKNNNPLTPLILWSDERVTEIDPVVQQLWLREDFLSTTGTGIHSTGFCVAKLRWFQQYQPEIWTRAVRIMTISDYLVYSLIGETSGDQGTASLLGLWDLPNKCWWTEAMRLLDILHLQWSSPLAPGATAGKISSKGSEYLGLKIGIPLAVGSLDHHIAAIGAGLGSVGDLSESTGTVLACLCYSDKFEPQLGCCIGPGTSEAIYYRFAFNENGAASLEWYRKNFAPTLKLTDLLKQAASAEIGCEGLSARPLVFKYSDRSGFSGINNNHRHGHFVRAIMESIATSLSGLIDDLCHNDQPQRIVATGGGARSDLWLQMKADMLGVEFATTACQEPASLGAALLAAVAAGWFADCETAAKTWITINKEFFPDAKKHKIYQKWLDEK